MVYATGRKGSGGMFGDLGVMLEGLLTFVVGLAMLGTMLVLNLCL